MNECPHDLATRETACNDGMCPICLKKELVRARAELEQANSLIKCYHEDLLRERGIKCPQCGMVSHNLNDIKEKYCGHCHQWHEDMKK